MCYVGALAKVTDRHDQTAPKCAMYNYAGQKFPNYFARICKISGTVRKQRTASQCAGSCESLVLNLAIVQWWMSKYAGVCKRQKLYLMDEKVKVGW